MTSTFPPAAVPGPDGDQGWEHPDEQQPDPFGEPTDGEGGSVEHDDDTAEREKRDPRAQ